MGVPASPSGGASRAVLLPVTFFCDPVALFFGPVPFFFEVAAAAAGGVDFGRAEGRGAGVGLGSALFCRLRERALSRFFWRRVFFVPASALAWGFFSGDASTGCSIVVAVGSGASSPFAASSSAFWAASAAASSGIGPPSRVL